jgi:hypothetical protein
MVKTLRMTTLAPLAALLLAMIAMLATTPITARAAVEASAAGNIIDNRITSVTINLSTSIATIGGIVQCSTPTQVKVYGAVRQSHGASDRDAQYFGLSLVPCGTTPTPYTVAVTPGYESARLNPGVVSAGVWATYCDTTGCYGLGHSGDMRLVPAR